MKRAISIGIFLLAYISSMSLHAQWAKTYGGTASDYPYSIKQTSDGGYIVAGMTWGFDAGVTNMLIVKLSSEGDIEWQKTYGGSGEDGSWNTIIQETSDGGYIVATDTASFGAGGKDVWILKLFSDGEIEWQKTYGTTEDDDARGGIRITSDGGYVVAGRTWISGYYDFWVLKLNSSGNIEWQKSYGGRGHQYADSVQQTSDGGYVVAGSSGYERYGSWIIKLSFEGNIEWQRTYGGEGRSYNYRCHIQQTSDGGYIVTDYSDLFGTGMYDFLVLKLNSSGDIEWQKTYGGSDDDFVAVSIQQTSEGGYIVTGITSSFGAGGFDIWVLKLFSDGDIEWEKTYGSGNTEQPFSIQQTSDGGYIVAGYTSSGGQSTDMLILKISPDGNIEPCGLVGSSNAIVTTPSVSPVDTTVIPIDTNATPQSTNISPRTTDASSTLLCPGYALTISKTTGGTTDPAPGSHTYNNGTEVTITAIPDSGYEFSGWSGDATGTTNPIMITMDSEKSIKANFSTIEGEEKKEKKGLCFIATSAYGSPLHPHVKILRDFRDKYLMPGKLGRKLVELYYKYSPFFADLIAKHKALKVAIRFSLLPVIVFSYSMVHFGPIITVVLIAVIFMLPIFLILFFRRRMSRLEAKDTRALASLS